MKQMINRGGFNVGRNVLLFTLLVASFGWAQNQNGGGPTFRGIVVGMAEDRRSFTIVDQQGSLATVRIGNTTTFEANKAPINFAAAVVFGMDVRGNLGPDGVATSVSARGRVNQVDVNQLQPFMAASDEEWAVLKPKIDRVQALSRIVNGRGNGGGNGNGNGNDGNAAPLRNPVQELQTTLRNSFFDQPDATTQLKSELYSLRQAREQARAELTAARSQLQALLTIRQETLLVIMGILE